MKKVHLFCWFIALLPFTAHATITTWIIEDLVFFADFPAIAAGVSGSFSYDTVNDVYFDIDITTEPGSWLVEPEPFDQIPFGGAHYDSAAPQSAGVNFFNAAQAADGPGLAGDSVLALGFGGLLPATGGMVELVFPTAELLCGDEGCTIFEAFRVQSPAGGFVRSVPEPTALWMLVPGLLGLLLTRRRVTG